MSAPFRSAILASFVACTAAMAAASDPALLALVPPDATVLSGISVAQAKNSTFGQYLLSQMQITDPGYQQFVTDTGFDPRYDLSTVLSATSGDASTAKTKLLILGRGNFNLAKITSSAQAQGATIQTYNGVTLLVHGGTDITGAIAFLDPTIAVIGDIQSVQSAIDRRGKTITLPPAVVAQVTSLAAANDAWFLSTVSPSVFFAGKVSNPQLGGTLNAGLAQSVLSGNGGFKFTATGASVSGQAVARSPQDATALADVFRFLVSIVQANRGTSVEAGNFATALDTLQITTDGSNLNLALQIPESTMEQLFMNGPGAKHSPGAQRASRHVVELH